MKHASDEPGAAARAGEDLAWAAWGAAHGTGSGDTAVRACRAGVQALQEARRPVGQVLAWGARAAWAQVGAAGGPGVDDLAARRQQGAFDTPWSLAQRVVGLAMDEARRSLGRAPRQAFDLSCGVGTLLAAAQAAGVLRVAGVEQSAAAAAVANAVLGGGAVLCADAVHHRPETTAELVLGNPPFVSAERQGSALRAALRAKHPWLEGRYDLAVPLLWQATDAVAPGGVLAQIVPTALLTERYARALRRRWLVQASRITLTPLPAIEGAAVALSLVVVTLRGRDLSAEGAACVVCGPDSEISASALLALDHVPLETGLRAGDVALVQQISAASVPLGSLCRVDTGVVVHGGGKTKADRVHDTPGPGRVSFADARDLFAGRRRWLDWEPDAMHRSKDAALFEGPKVAVQRFRGRGPVRVMVDATDGVLGHTVTVAKPMAHTQLSADVIAALLRHPAVLGWLRVARGARRDLYPHDVAAVPVPKTWCVRPPEAGTLTDCLQRGWGLDKPSMARLDALAIGARR